MGSNMVEVKDSKLIIHSRYEDNHKCNGDCPAKGRLAKEYCYDGLHLNAQGFEVGSENIIPLLK